MRVINNSKNENLQVGDIICFCKYGEPHYRLVCIFAFENYFTIDLSSGRKLVEKESLEELWDDYVSSDFENLHIIKGKRVTLVIE